MRIFLDEQVRTRLYVFGVQRVRRKHKGAENTAHRGKGHFYLKTRCHMGNPLPAPLQFVPMV